MGSAAFGRPVRQKIPQAIKDYRKRRAVLRSDEMVGYSSGNSRISVRLRLACAQFDTVQRLPGTVNDDNDSRPL